MSADAPVKEPLDTSLAKTARTVAVAGAGAAVTVAAAKPGLRAVCYHVYIINNGTGATELTFKSAATEITGDMPLSVAELLELRNAPLPVLIANAVNEALTVANSATEALEGFAVVGYADV